MKSTKGPDERHVGFDGLQVSVPTVQLDVAHSAPLGRECWILAKSGRNGQVYDGVLDRLTLTQPCKRTIITTTCELASTFSSLVALWFRLNNQHKTLAGHGLVRLFSGLPKPAWLCSNSAGFEQTAANTCPAEPRTSSLTPSDWLWHFPLGFVPHSP